MSEPTLSIIVVNWNTRAITLNCLASIREHVYGITTEVIVVDNASTDGSVEAIRSEFPEVRLIVNATNLGFGRANNQAMRAARGRHFLLLNSDTLLIDDSVVRLVAFIERQPDVGIAGCKLLFEDHRLQASCARFPSIRTALVEELMLYKFLPHALQGEMLLGTYWDHDRERDVDCVWGTAMLVRREVFEQTGGFDERYFMYGEDIDWCLRVHARGWRIAFTPECRVVHLDHKSAEQRYGDERVELCYRRLYEIYRRRNGAIATALLFFLKTIGALIRASYFSLRDRGRRETDAYFNSQAKYHRRSLRYHLRAALGLDLRIGSANADCSVVP